MRDERSECFIALLCDYGVSYGNASLFVKEMDRGQWGRVNSALLLKVLWAHADKKSEEAVRNCLRLHGLAAEAGDYPQLTFQYSIYRSGK